VASDPKHIAIGIDLYYPFKHHAGLAAGILKYAAEHGWTCHFEPFIGPETPELDASHYDGVIARFTSAGAACVRRAHLPAVNVWINSPDSSLPRVVLDQRAAGRLAARHLIEQGFRRFAFLGYPRDKGGEQQLEGFTEEIGTVDGTCTTHFTAMAPQGARQWHRHRVALTKWAKRFEKPIGVFATQDLAGRYLAQVCQALGFQLPGEVALIGCGNLYLLCEAMQPKLSSIEQRPTVAGYVAAELLHKLMRGAPAPKEPILIEPAGLVPRQSTDAYAVEDPTISAALRYLLQHCTRRISVSDVASAARITRRSLERSFRAVVGRSVHEELTRLRMMRAKRMLVKGEASIKKVALECGFSTSERLSKLFRQRVGISPSEYRRTHRA
jgi:LacI family transcriptional regulator